MSQSSKMVLMTAKSSTKTTQMSNVTGDVLSEVPVKTSLISQVRHSWLLLVVSLIAVAGVVGTVGIAIVSFAILRPTTLSTSTTTPMTGTTTTTDTRCFTIPSPRPSNVWLSVDNMTFARVYHASTLISQDNSVLITGGSNGVSTGSSVDKYISSTGCFQPMRNMPRVRYEHTIDQLPSLFGYVVIAGGYGVSGAIDVADLYHSITGDIITVSLTSARYRHTSTILSSSQLVLIGGFTTGAVTINSSDMIDTGSTSLFVSGIDVMNEPHVYHAATLLGNNSDVVLITGGDYSGGYIATAYLYHGSSNSFISLGSGVTMLPARIYHTSTYLPPPIHKVLIVGGAATNGISGAMLLFDIASLTFSTLTSTLVYPRYLHTATLLPNGKVLIVAGYNGTPLGVCELIDPLKNYTVTLAGNLTTNRYYHTTTFIPDSSNGTVLVCGGYNPSSVALNTCELYFV